MPDSPPDVASPCNKICTLNAADICVGCGRHRQEIAAWSQAANEERQRIVEIASERLARIAGTESAGQST